MQRYCTITILSVYIGESNDNYNKQIEDGNRLLNETVNKGYDIKFVRTSTIQNCSFIHYVLEKTKLSSEDECSAVSSSGEIHREEYQAVEIPLKKIREMMEDGCWHGSLEEEEVMYNLEHKYYSDKYEKELKKLLKENK